MIVLPPIRYRVFWYAISTTEVDIQHGIIFIKRSVVPMHRVQSLRTERGPIADHYRMTNLKIRTAGGSVSLSGLDRDEADELCDRISRLARSRRRCLSHRSGSAVPDTRLHPIYLITETAKTLRQAIPFLVVTIFGGAPWWVNAALFALVMVIAIAQWHVRKYSVVGGVLLLRSGLVNRSVRTVPITRITALAASQSLTQRLIGVWRLTCSPRAIVTASAVSLALPVRPPAGRTPRRAGVRWPGRRTRRPGSGPRPVDHSALPGLAAHLGGLCAGARPAGDRGIDHGRNADRRRDQQLDLADPRGCAGGVVPVLRIPAGPA